MLLWAAAAAATAVMVRLHAAAAASATVPVFSDDEIGPLATAHLVAGVGPTMELANLSYYPGWAVAIAPLWWFTEDPRTVYHLAVALAAACACLTALPLAAVARAVTGIRVPTALLVGTVVMTAPSRVVMSNYALTEAFFALVVACTAWLGLRHWRRRTWVSGLALAVAASFAFFSHGRGVVVPIATAMLLVVSWLRGRDRRDLVWLATLVVTTVVLFRVHQSLSATIYPATTDSREDFAVRGVIDGLRGPLGQGAAGQLWYALAAWCALPLLGAVVLVRRAWREWRTDRVVGAAAWWAVTVLGGVGMASLAATNIMARDSERFDVQMYGRYVDPFLLPLAALALASVAAGLVPLVRRTTAALAVLVAGGFVAMWDAVGQADGVWYPINIAGLLAWDWSGLPGQTTRSVHLATLAGLVVLALVLTFRGRLRFVGIVAVAVALTLSTEQAQTETVWPWNAANRSEQPIVPAMAALDEALGTTVPVEFLELGAPYPSQNFTQYWLAQRDVTVLHASRDASPDAVVVANPRWVIGRYVLDARRIAVLPGRHEALWVLPGQLSRQLDAAGLLEPRPGRPLEDLSHRLELVDDLPRTARSGAQSAVEVIVTNQGTQTWPGLTTTPEDSPGAVRLVLRWTQGESATLGLVDLNGSLLPGESARLAVPLEPPESFAPGMATVGLFLIQEGLAPLGDGVSTDILILRHPRVP